MRPDSTAGRRRRHRVSNGQPSVEGEHARLTAKSHRHHHKNAQQQGAVLPRPGKVQHAAGSKQVGGAVALENKQSQQSQSRSRHRETQVAVGGLKGLSGTNVQHQRDREESHHLIKEIKHHQIACKTDAHQGAQGHQVETEKPLPVTLVVHVLKGKDSHRKPDEADEVGKQPPQRVSLEHQPRPVGELEQDKGLGVVPGHLQHHKDLKDQQQSDGEPPGLHIVDAQYSQAAQDGN